MLSRCKGDVDDDVGGAAQCSRFGPDVLHRRNLTETTVEVTGDKGARVVLVQGEGRRGR